MRLWRSRAVDALYRVSIHAPREGCDYPAPVGYEIEASFNSRTPGGVRPDGVLASVAERSRFNSRTPGGVRLQTLDELKAKAEVSIHAPREGCDPLSRSPKSY